jgi:hypothetical protein
MLIVRVIYQQLGITADRKDRGIIIIRISLVEIYMGMYTNLSTKAMSCY